MHLARPFIGTFADVEKANCFVPFVKGKPEQIERQAIAAKRCFGLPDGAAIDPREVVQRIQVPLVDQHAQFNVLTPEIRDQILGGVSQQWSAATIEGSAGPLIVVNPNHAPTRVKVTLAEELSHLVIGHPPSEIDPSTGMRTYNTSVEEEAFGVGGALVMPYGQLFRLVKEACPLPEIARSFGVSQMLANCRINRTGLRRMYEKRKSA